MVHAVSHTDPAAFVTLALAATTASHQNRKGDAAQLKDYKTAERIAQANLRKFDTFDYDVFSNQKWDRLKEIHADDITVYWPDGHVERGIDRHISSLKYMFT